MNTPSSNKQMDTKRVREQMSRGVSSPVRWWVDREKVILIQRFIEDKLLCHAIDGHVFNNNQSPVPFIPVQTVRQVLQTVEHVIHAFADPQRYPPISLPVLRQAIPPKV